MSDQHDYLALDWVKGEIQETLNQSQQALEAYVENPDDSTRMRFCQTYLHQVVGTLQMVEFYGAALLAEEMEKLAASLLDGKVSQVEDAQETLMRAILQLPPYLDRIQQSRRDQPLVLMPLLNDLRAARGESLLSETALFKPDLAGGAGHGDVPEPVSSDPSFPALARKIRQMYQIALLGVIRSDNLATNYSYMAKVFAKLRQLTGDAQMSPLWVIAAAMVEGLSANSIQAGTSVKSVLGHVDRILKKITVEGSEVLRQTPPAELLKNLLYYVAKAEKETPLVVQVRETYRLADALPDEDALNEERARMSGPDQAAMGSVAQALCEELNKVKDALEAFVHNEDTDVSRLAPQSQILKQVSDTVAVLGLGQPRQLINDQLEVLDGMVSGSKPADRSALMDVAGALLYVEATLQGMSGERRTSSGDGALAAAPDHVEKARDAVIRESRAGLEEAKDGIVEFIASQWDRSHLQGVPDKLTAVRGGLEVILLARPSAILRQCVNYINEKLLGEEESKPDWRAMDTLADAITSVEYYLERLTDDPDTSDDILDVARSSVASLGYEISDEEFGRGAGGQAETGAGVGALASEEIDVALPAVDVAADDAGTPTHDDDQEVDGPVEHVEAAGEEQSAADAEAQAEDSTDSEAAVSEEATPGDESPDELSLELPDEGIAADDSAAEPEPAPQEPSQPEVAAEPEPEAEEEDDLIDDEIIEIFVEEADEVLEALNEYFPRWAANTSDEEALVEFRRAFHTLKGSGRMVGATIVGELAWSVENMMNRVIDKTIEPTPVLIELVQTVHGQIPALVKAFSTRTKPPYDTQPLQDAAWTLAEGGSIDAVPDVTAGDAPAPAEENVEAAAAPVQADDSGDDAPYDHADVEEISFDAPAADADAAPGYDPVLMDIFRNEGEANLALLNEWLQTVDRDLSENPLDDKVHRALHTLKGSARMADLNAVASLAEPAEKYIKGLINAGAPANRETVELLEQAAALFQRTLEDLANGPVDHIEGADDLAARFRDLSAAAQGAEAGGQDAHIISVFLSEGMDLIMDADSLLARWSENPGNTEELEKLRDELGLVARSADTAGVEEAAELASLLADCYSAVAEGRLAHSERFVELAQQAQEGLITMMDFLAAGQTIYRDEALIAELRALLDGAGPDGPDGGGDDDTADFEVEEIQFEAPAEPEAPASEPGTPGAGDDDLYQAMGDMDPELVGIFLEEADEVLESASMVLDAWQGGDASEVPALQRDLHTLKGGARMAGVSAIGDLAHELENLYEGFNEGQFEVSEDLFTLLHRCHDTLADMVDGVRNEGGCKRAPDLVQAINQFLATGSLQSSQEDAVDVSAASEPADETVPPEQAVTHEVEQPQPEEAPAPAPEPVAVEAAPAPPPPERDPELVEIFLEEADEILESAGTSLESWMEMTDNLIEVQSLQRDLHTLKGGARMAEIPELGDLGHELENLYEGLAMSTLKATPVLFELLHRCHDRLAEMVEAVKAGEGLHPAAELIQAIHDYIANPDGFVMPALAAPQPAAAAPATPAPESPSPEPETAPASAAVTLPDDVDADILSIFIEESAELCEALDRHLSAWEENPQGIGHGDELKRVLHTLKGGARLANLKDLGDVSHDFETALEHADLRKAPSTEFLAQMRAWGDRIQALVEGIKQAATAPAAAPAAPAPAQKADVPAAAPGKKQQQDQQQAAKRAAAAQAPQEMVRIDAGVLESLVNLAGETSINRGRVEQGVSEFAGHVTEMGNTIERLYEQLRRLDVETEAQIMSNYQQGIEAGEFDEDFDPLEMDQYSELHQITKQLSESASDLLDLKQTLLDRSRDTETLLLQQARVNTELQERLMRTRMVPFTRLVPRLRRIVRQISGEISKKVEFDVINPEGELDRTLLERVVAPLEHMLRNAVDHGIEDAEGRKAAGKDETGRVSLELTREGGEVVLTLADDGKGIDTKAVLRKAIERGLVEPGVQLTEQEVQQFIFSAGFSTAEKVTQISGRGVGMDVVASEIKQMGGTVTIDSVLGQGTRFIIRLPFTLAMNRALMVRVAEDSYAIPLNQIEGIVRISPYELEAFMVDEPPPFRYAGRDYELDYLGTFVHGGRMPQHLLSHPSPLPVLLIRSSEHVVAIVVDSLIGSREVVVKSVGPQLSTVAGISGATILGDGSVVIILDIHSLIRAAHLQRQHALAEGKAVLLDEPVEAAQHEEKKVGPPLVMVTDDSVTVRKVTTRLLERNGFEVITAKDGIDAIAKLEEYKPDVMLLDIEMPRMDGFEVATHVRHEERLKDVPIIMITSRTGEKHRERAFDIGVNCYMGKPFQEGELLSTIQDLLGESRETAST
ncbi:MAG: Hpt domain-containing protein [Alcanivoracaceae bacterium]|nr:Hpt domain-containing protein [Alcanivoracaceae bacterium]